MTVRTKSTLILLATFVIGMLLGAAIHSRIGIKRIEESRRLRTDQGLIRFLHETIQPDASQEAIVRDIIMERVRKMHERRRQIMQETDKQLDSLKLELEPHLRPDQMERLSRRLDFMPMPPRRRPRH